MSKNIAEERMQVLKMVEEGKISVAEGMELLTSIDKNQQEIVPKKDAKWLKVRVKTMEDKSKVKVNIPLSLIDVGLKLGAAYAPQLKESGLDKINFDEIIEAAKSGAEGKIVDIEDEETQTKVEIYIE